MKEQTNSWENEFDEIFKEGGYMSGDIKRLKVFISKTISQEKEKWTKEVEALEPYYHPQPDNESMFRAYQSGYNKAREEILDLLQNK